METMQLITSPTDTALLALDDDAIEALFGSAGISIEIVDHCDSAACPECFRRVPARAA